jgi:hypothetical protein
MLAEDQCALDRPMFVRRLAKRLRRKEFMYRLRSSGSPRGADMLGRAA